VRRVPLAIASTYVFGLLLAAALPAFSEQVSSQPVLRAESPMLAPIRLSDAYQSNAPPPAVSNRFVDGQTPSPQIVADEPAEPLHSTPLPPADSTASPPADASAGTPPLPPIPNSTNKSPSAATAEPARRAPPDPLDPVFAMTNYPGGPLIGVPDTDPVWPLESILYKACPLLKKYRIKIYGWTDPSYNASTSKHSNVPLSYSIVPNRLEMSQMVGRIERQPDTVQTEHCDWGFRVTPLYGIDYRYIVAPGWEPAATGLLKHNDLYNMDYPELYGLLYVPKVAQGMVLKLGRYISPPDIEAQLSPDNFLYTHSCMFTYDAYTHTGLQSTVKLNNQWMVQAGIHAGTDNSPWTRSAHPSLECFARWVSKNNANSIYGGIDSINGGSYKFNKDNLQQLNVTYSHRFNERINTMTEAYYLYTFDALKGGTVSNGPVKGFGGGGGPGAALPGYSGAWGFVNYTNIKITNKDYISIRPIDYLLDPRGFRCGFGTTLCSWTVGWCHRFSDLLCIRPEVRYEHTIGGANPAPYDNGTRRYQFTFSCDLIQRF
jgi:hypothetical protein